jgi:DNA-entry nuclease
LKLQKLIIKPKAILAVAVAAVMLTGCGEYSGEYPVTDSVLVDSEQNNTENAGTVLPSGFSLADVPEYKDSPYTYINGNIPYFTSKDLTTDPMEEYSDLDELGRCGEAFANICTDTMPTEERGEIGSVKPSGWHTVKYNGIVDGNYLYNRCHLIAYCLAGENANEKNLITGTRYFNTEGMLPFEKEVAQYVEDTGNHVLYRVTPVFKGDELVARGVLMEAISVENCNDFGFCVYVYNVQPGITIDYKTGESWISGVSDQNNTEDITKGTEEATNCTYIINSNTGKFHKKDCSSVQKMNAANRNDTDQTREELIADGYIPCGICSP